ncbi:MAG: 1-(5-phosphoribosyl)-5-[Clostridia bacterium]|nr:1-(5-phosphoribosyl)-5-[(5-phosphoribosylamino)methylideneamino]imidazole-4-carboxamide isomerase [Clostridia bacterium]
MLIFPAIDLFEQKAVRLLKGDYQNMTVYSNSPLTVARDFALCGAEWIHMVDLEGAKFGSTPNFEVVRSVCENTDLKLEIGGGIRDIKTVSAYLSCGVRRVILGTAAVTDPHFLEEAVERYGDKIAVGVDLKDGLVAIKGWTEVSDQSAFSFCERMQKIGVSTLICTDISKDGAMKGTNVGLYREMSERFSLRIIASGGVSTMEDVKRLRELDLYGAIIGKAYYTGAIDLKEAIEVSK